MEVFAVHCFLRGTLIRDVEGYRPIETLAVGDLLPTRFSGKAAIRKIVRHTVSRDDLGYWPQDSRPVHISAGALGGNAPSRDLIVTNSLEMFRDGVLVPAQNLVNGRSIVFDDDPIGIYTLEYFHVEFDAHDVIDAEGALSESYRDQETPSCAPVLPFDRGIYSRLRRAIAPFFDLAPAARPDMRRPEDGRRLPTGLRQIS
jgi:hypothetical protein